MLNTIEIEIRDNGTSKLVKKWDGCKLRP